MSANEPKVSPARKAVALIRNLHVYSGINEPEPNFCGKSGCGQYLTHEVHLRVGESEQEAGERILEAAYSQPVAPGAWEVCPRCEGHCNVYDYDAMAGPAQDFSRPFDSDGYIIPCQACQGSGRVPTIRPAVRCRRCKEVIADPEQECKNFNGPMACEPKVAPPAVSTPPISDATLDLICRDVAELPDRDSPEDWPEAMLVTYEELKTIIRERLSEERTA